MEHKLHILLITLLALLAGACISPRDRETTLKLNRLERKLDSLPGRESGRPLLDSLEAIPASSLTSDRLRAHHALLLTQARRKEKLPLNEDSIIRNAFNYYSASSDRRRRMKSALYLSVADEQNGNIPDAFYHANLAYNSALQLRVPLWIARAADQIGSLSYERFYNTEVCKFNKIAAENYSKAGFKINAQYCILDCSNGYIRQDKYAKAQELIDSVLQAPTDCLVFGAALSSAVFNRLRAGDFEKAEQFMNQLEQLGDAYPWETDNYFDKAELELYRQRDPFPYLNQVRDECEFVGSKARYYTILRDYYRKKSDFRTTTLYCDSILSLQYGFFLKAFNENTSSKTAEYFQDLSDKTDKEFSRSVKRTALLLILLSIIATIFLINNLYRKYQGNSSKSVKHLKLKEITINNILLFRKLAEYSVDNKRLLDKNISLSQDRIDLFKKQWNTLNIICNEYLNTSGSSANKHNVYSQLEKQLNQLKRPKKLDELISIADSYLDGLITTLKTECPSLSPDQQKLFGLMAVGFAPTTISFLCGFKINYYYLKKNRLIKKLAELNPPHLGLFMTKVLDT